MEFAWGGGHMPGAQCDRLWGLVWGGIPLPLLHQGERVCRPPGLVFECLSRSELPRLQPFTARGSRPFLNGPLLAVRVRSMPPRSGSDTNQALLKSTEACPERHFQGLEVFKKNSSDSSKLSHK